MPGTKGGVIRNAEPRLAAEGAAAHHAEDDHERRAANLRGEIFCVGFASEEERLIVVAECLQPHEGTPLVLQIGQLLSVEAREAGAQMAARRRADILDIVRRFSVAHGS